MSYKGCQPVTVVSVQLSINIASVSTLVGLCVCLSVGQSVCVLQQSSWVDPDAIWDAELVDKFCYLGDMSSVT